MPECMNALNEELSHCLRAALRKKKNLRSYSNNYFKSRTEEVEVLDMPVMARFGALISLAEELEVVVDVYSIIFRWQLNRNPKPIKK